MTHDGTARLWVKGCQNDAHNPVLRCVLRRTKQVSNPAYKGVTAILFVDGIQAVVLLKKELTGSVDAVEACVCWTFVPCLLDLLQHPCLLDLLQ